MPPAATASHQRTTVYFPSSHGIPPLVFESRTGGGVTVTAEKKGRGGAFKAASLPGPGEIGDITVRRAFETIRDAPLLAQLEPLQGLVSGVQVVTTFLDAARNPHPRVKPRRWSNCTFMAVTGPDHDDDSGATSYLQLVLAPNEPAK